MLPGALTGLVQGALLVWLPKPWFCVTGNVQLVPYSKADAPNTAIMQCGAQPLIFGVQLWMFAYSKGLPGVAPRWWSSAPQEIILSTKAPGRGRWSWGVRAGVCFMWFKTAWEDTRVWNNTGKVKKWFCCNDISSLVKLACCVTGQIQCSAHDQNLFPYLTEVPVWPRKW